MPSAERHPETYWMPELSMGIAHQFKEVTYVED
jgi:hypothetical protein